MRSRFLKRHDLFRRGLIYVLCFVMILPTFLLPSVAKAATAPPWPCTNQLAGDPGGCGTPGGGMPAFSGTPSASTGDSILRSRGAVTDMSTDVSLPGSVFGWRHSRDYDSRLADETGDPVAVANSGDNWTAVPYIMQSCDDVDNIELVYNGSIKLVYEGSGGVFTSPSGADNVMVKSGSGSSEIYTVTGNGTGDVLVFYGNSILISDYNRGRLKERTTRAFQALSKSGQTYTYETSFSAAAGMVDRVTTPEMSEINYTYDSSTGDLEKIEVYDGSVASGTLVQKAEYTYYDDVSPANTALGSSGDLVQVKVSRKDTSDTGSSLSMVKTTQYRYFRDGGSDAGEGHQLKSVFESDAIERITSAGNTAMDTTDEILDQSDSVTVASGNALDTYTSRAFTYYTSNLDTGSSVTTPWGSENLQTKYGGTNLDESDGGDFGWVKTSTANGGCSSCGGGGAGIGITTTYFFMDLNGGTSTDSSDVVRIVVEDREDSSGDEVSRTIFGLNTQGAALRTAKIEDPTASPVNAWCNSILVNSDHRITERRAVSAHTVVDSDSELKKFLDPSTGTNDSDTLNSGAGIITVMEYNGDGYITGTRVKQGSSGTSYYTSATDWTDHGTSGATNYLPSASYDYSTATTTRTSGDKTTLSYTFWSGTNDTVVKKRTRTLPIISSGQNGSGVASVSEVYYDDMGRQRWTKDAIGYVTYVAHNPDTGSGGLRIADVDPSSPGSEVTAGSSGKWDAWTVGDADGNKPTRGTGLATAIAQTTKTEYDAQGRGYKQIDAAGSEHYTVYEETRTIRFPHWDGSKSLMPVSISVTNEAGQVTESISVRAGYTAVSTSSSEPTGFSTEPGRSDYTSWSRNFYGDQQGQPIKTLNYHDIPSSGDGSHVTNYYVSGREYDDQGRVKTTISTSTATDHQVSQNVYDWMGRTIETKSGAGSSGLNTGASSTLGTLSLPTLVTLASMVYDGDDVGDGRVTSSRSYYGSGTDYLETIPHYTWRGQVRGSERKNGTTSIGPWSLRDIDWKGKVTASATYTTEPTWASFITDEDFVSTTSSGRNNLSKPLYDDLGRVYCTHSYPGTESTKHFESNIYYNANGQQVAASQTNGMASEAAYDGLGRGYQSRTVTTLESTKFSSGKYQYRSPLPKATLSSMTGGDDEVITMSHSVFDDTEGGRTIGSHSFAAHHDDTNGIDLSANDDYIRTTSYVWHDDMGRTTESASYGSGDGSGADVWKYVAVPTRAASAPSSSDAVPVSSVSYNADTGRAETTTDPTGIETKTWFDDAGRTTFRAENYTNFDPTNIASTVGGGTEDDEDRVTGFEYNGAGTTKQTAYNSGSANQVTENLFEDSVDVSRITATIYPDSSGSSDKMSFTFHRDGARNTRTDQLGVVHTYTYDDNRRISIDRATTIPGTVDDSIKSIKRSYDSLGRTTAITSYSGDNADGSVVNQIQQVYYAVGTLRYQYQSHSGTATGSDWKTTQYYDVSTSGDVLNDSLRSYQTTYGGGNGVYRYFGVADTIGERSNRIAEVRLNDWGGVPLSEYQHMGNGSLVQSDLEQVSVRNSLHGNDSDGEYEGLDRMGRNIDQQWYRYAGTTAMLDEHYSTYDRIGNRLTKDIPSSLYATDDRDQKFVYDDLDRLTQLEQGTLSGGSITSRQHEQQWDRDQLGNWDNFKERDTDTGSTWDTDQDRTHNAANEISTIAAASTHVAHDNSGNMTKTPLPSNSAAHYDVTYDAWNRVVTIKSGATVVQANEYDGLNRRIVRDESGDGGLKLHFYHDGNQVVEERVEVGGTIDPQPLNTYYYHPHYIDAVICRDYDVDTNGSSVRHHYLYDTTFNVTALVDSAKNVIERYAYDPYGKVTVLDADYSLDADNMSDVGNEVLFTSRRLDPKSELYYFRARFYHAQLGRFISRDPIGYVDGMSLYRAYFVPGGMDPFGLECCSQWTRRSTVLGYPFNKQGAAQCVMDRFGAMSPLNAEIVQALINGGIGGGSALTSGALSKALAKAGVYLSIVQIVGLMSDFVDAGKWCRAEICTKFVDPVEVTVTRGWYNPAGLYCRTYTKLVCPDGSTKVTPDKNGDVIREPKNTPELPDPPEEK